MNRSAVGLQRPDCSQILLQVRFLFPVTPLCTAAAAACLAKIYKQCRGRAAARAGWHVAVWPAAALTLAAVLLMSRSSHFNYPGAAALAHVRSMVRKTAPSLPTHSDLPPKALVARVLHTAG